MKLSDRIIDYLLRVKKPVTLDQLVAKSTATGFSELDVLTALEDVHKDKRIQVRNLASGVTYSPAIAKAKPGIPTHVTWWRENYPTMTPDTDGSGIDIDLGHLFLRTKEERDEYKAAATGQPVLYNKRNGKQGKRSTEVNP